MCRRHSWSLLLALAAVVLPGALSAQWISQRTPGVPRLADGKPNLKAAAPRTREGRPDLSGIWYLHFDSCGPFGCADYQAGPEFFNFGATLPGGLPYQPWAAELVKQRMAAFAKDDPIGLCRPGGLFRFHTYPPPRKMLQLPNLVVILSERDVTYRQIFVDGRRLPADLEPTWNGYSAGRWDGDALVVESAGFRDDTWIDRNGSPLTSAARVTERFRRPDFGHLQIEVTVTDPKAYTRPWTVTLTQDLAVDTELLDYHCTDNERSAGRLVGP
jgi:hypothetical protein